jgi:hypothetical protein
LSTLPEHLDHPAVETLCSTCPSFKDPAEKCHEAGCGVAYQRSGHEQRVRDDAAREKDRCNNMMRKDAKAKEDGKCL